MRAAVSMVLGFALLAAARGEAGEITAGPGAFTSASAQAEERALLKVLDAYARAIEVKDVALFRTVKPNLSQEEERRARKAFESVQSQTVVMTILSVEVEGGFASVKVGRRDTITVVKNGRYAFRVVEQSRMHHRSPRTGAGDR